jgi:hypothetical protein
MYRALQTEAIPARAADSRVIKQALAGVLRPGVRSTSGSRWRIFDSHERSCDPWLFP